MTNLKTLKDMKYYPTTKEHPSIIGEINGNSTFVCVHCLRQEAIKWVNELEKSVFPDRVLKIAQIDWIKHFFGISEDDLK